MEFPHCDNKVVLYCIVYWFQTTVGVQQGCLLTPTLSNIYLERIMTDALEDHEGTVSIGGRTITNLCSADEQGVNYHTLARQCVLK